MFRQQACVEFADGTVVPLRSLTRRVPSTLRRSDEHVQLCEWVANKASLDDDERCVYVNQLVVHSDLLFELTALAFLIKQQAIKVTRLTLPMPVPEPIREHLANVISKQHNRPKPAYLGWRSRLKTCLKILAHFGFRSLGRRLPRTEKVIRSYVEDSLKAHQKHAQDAAILVYPFKTSILRQWRFLSSQRAARRTVHLTGFPYHWLDPLRILRAVSAADETLIRIETAAAKRHGDELAAKGIREVFSCSDSETTGWALNNRLSRHGVRTHNVVHGVGVYGPYLWFEHGAFFNQKQWDYYRPRSRITSVTMLRDQDQQLDERRRKEASRAIPSDIVLLRGNWENVHKIFELEFEEQVADVAAQAARDLGITFWIKFHPNTRKSIRQQLCTKYRARDLPALDSDKCGDHPLFINTLSTVYYTARNFGPVIFVRHPWQDPREVFGDRIQTTTLSDLPKVIYESISPSRTEPLDSGHDRPGSQD